MKIKYIPNDFIVEEVANYQLTSKSNILLFRLIKKNITTLKAIEKIYKYFKSVRKIGFWGLKDKYSLSSQFITIHSDNIDNNAIQTSLNFGSFSLEFVGYLIEDLDFDSIVGNKFDITIRDIDREELKEYLENIQKISSISKFLNYYDYQRISLKNLKVDFWELFGSQNFDHIEKFIQEHVKISENREKISRKFNFIRNRERQIRQALMFNIWLSFLVLRKIKDFEYPLKFYSTNNVMIIPSINDQTKFVFDQLRGEFLGRKLTATISDMDYSFDYDEYHRGRYKINLRFFLDKGAFATVLIKHIIPFFVRSRVKYKHEVIFKEE